VTARLTRRLFAAMTAENTPEAIWQERLAVVSPHRAQNAAIRAALANDPAGNGAVVETVDNIQGKERDAIIASYTVSDPEFALAEAEFIFSLERLNVTITRARTKLILIVSRRLLDVVPPDETPSTPPRSCASSRSTAPRSAPSRSPTTPGERSRSTSACGASPRTASSHP